ncbi:DUF5794 domain-containing protein [Halosegnis longus]|uniref:Uncharacterized protein n=1 Tax=Halosegnis longus TaxID=2216012 RepID=A0AAJ4UW02_9EURY|nr:hypothetical protein Nmn1133_06890 [Salella cibi]
MSVSKHPVAVRLEQQVGKGTRLLATVMCLPLVDGIFPALVLAGALSTTLGIIEVGLLVFGGSATLAVVLAEMEGTRREQIQSILLVGVPLVVVAGVEAALAPTIANMLDIPTFERFAALVILAIAAKTASATVGEYLPSPGVIVGLGLVASFQPNSFELAFSANPEVVLRGMAAAGAGVTFALGAALFGPWLRGNVDIDRFRFGSAVALGVLPLSILGLIEANVPLALAVLAVTSLLSLDPQGAVDSMPVDDENADETEEPPADPGANEQAPWL